MDFKKLVLISLILICGCSYHKITSIKLKADKANVPIAGISTIRGENIVVEIEREVNIKR